MQLNTNSIFDCAIETANNELQMELIDLCCLHQPTFVNKLSLIMKVNNSKNRLLLIDSNLQSVLRISTSNLTPKFDKLLTTTIRCIILIESILLLSNLALQINLFHVNILQYLKIFCIFFL